MDKIIEKTLGTVANVASTFTSAEFSGQRVIYWYQLMFRHCPTVILNIEERSLNDPCAKIAAAARMLSYSHRLRVLVEGSGNTLPDELFVTMRG